VSGILSRTAISIAVSAALLIPHGAHALSLIRDAEIERTVARMSDPIFQAAGMSPASIDIYIVNDRSLNAFVAGGRNMFLHTGLLTTLETPEEVIGVIAHETGHIAGGHQTRRALNIRNARGPALLGLLAGAAIAAAGGGAAGAAVAIGSQDVVTRDILRYNRAEEAAADQAALSYLSRTGIDPEGFLLVLERFRGQEVFSLGNQDPYILTHPLSTQRLQLVERRVAEAGPGGSVDAETLYWFRRMQAKLRGFLDRPERVLNDLEGEPETEEALYAKAVALHRMPAPAEALATVDRLLEKRPEDPFYIELKGQLLFEMGRPQEAVHEYRSAAAKLPGEPLIQAGFGRVLLALNTPEANREALAVLEEARRADMGDVAALRSLAIAYARAGDDGMATLATAERFALVGARDDAILHAERAIKLLPNGSPGWLRAQDILAMKQDD